MIPDGHGCDSYKSVRLSYRKISDLNSQNKTKDVNLIEKPNKNWTDIENVNDNDRYELTLIVFNNEGLRVMTMKRLFPLEPGKQVTRSYQTLNFKKCLIMTYIY